MLQIREIKFSETVEVSIANVNARQYKFSDNETTLDRAIITGMSVNTAAIVSSFSGKTILADAEIKKCFLTLSTPDNQQPIKRLPLETFYNNQNFIIFMKPTLIDLRKSFIDIPNSAALVVPGNGLAIVITFYYDKTMPAPEHE